MPLRTAGRDLGDRRSTSGQCPAFPRALVEEVAASGLRPPVPGARNYEAVCPLQSAGYRAAVPCLPWRPVIAVMSGTPLLTYGRPERPSRVALAAGSSAGAWAAEARHSARGRGNPYHRSQTATSVTTGTRVGAAVSLPAGPQGSSRRRNLGGCPSPRGSAGCRCDRSSWGCFSSLCRTDVGGVTGLGPHAPFADRSTKRPCSTQSSLPPS